MPHPLADMHAGQHASLCSAMIDDGRWLAARGWHKGEAFAYQSERLCVIQANASL
jgi:hypothetical protein